MDIFQQDLALHPQWIDKLFAHKSKTRTIFRDVLTLHEVNHIAITYIATNNMLLTLSSTPSLEYNLLSSALWRFDNAYNPDWFKQCSHASWQSLYSAERYDELYYIKQIKPHYPLGLSMATILGSGYVIYSIASATDSEYTREIFSTKQEELLKLGQYCSTHLLSLLIDGEETHSPHTVDIL